MCSWTSCSTNLPCLLLALTMLLGCGGSKFGEVSGDVTFEGQPLANGSISFLPADGHGPTAAAVIEQGRYSAHVVPGRFKVQILGYRKIGERHANEGDPTTPMVDISEQILPEQYNSETTLTCEIKLGRQQLDFPLKAK